MAIQRELIELDTIAPVFSSTREREVVSGAVREPHTIRVEFTDEERAFYDAVLGKTQERLALSGPGAFKAALGNHHKLAFTFDSELARARPLLDFVTLRHLL